MMGRPRASLACVTLAALLNTAVAQPPTDAQKKQAGDLVKKAIAKSQAGDHQTAIELYLDAYKIVPNPLLLSNVGSEYQQDGKPVEALKYFCMYLEKDPAGTNASYATSQAKILQTELGNKDGEVCKPPKQVEPTPEPTPPVQTTATEPEPPRQVDHPAPAKPGRTMKLVGLGVTGAGLVATGVGVFFGLKAKDISDEISNHDPNTPWPTDIKQREADGQSYENKQVALLVAGGALAATGVVVYLIGSSKQSKSAERITLTPTASAQSVGFVVGGGF
ncbi:MAG TPA: tetratricopeptide repeat protein [Kofleriaceae bacterium]|nr:tetratricopeptide repeat protein [Kofleriaceae bacterium]